jgi:hypothetical protein
MTGTSGRTSPKLLATYDPATSSWRTSEDISPSVAKKWSRTLPAWGTASTGGLYELPTPVLVTGEPDSSSLLLPTVKVSDGGHAGPNQRGSKGDLGLTAALVRLLPTPTAANPNDGEALESWEARRQRNLAKGVNGNGQGTPLAIAVRLLPTPKANDSTGAGKHGSGGLDLPTTIRFLGETTNPPSGDGSASSDVRHLTPPNQAPETTDE